MSPLIQPASASGVFRPSPLSIVHYSFGIGYAAAGAFVLWHSPHFGWPAGIGAASLLTGVWMFLTTRSVRRTWCVVTPEKVSVVGIRQCTNLPWNEMLEIVIRERESGMIPGRADRQVIFRPVGGLDDPVNCSVLTEFDERAFLDQIRTHARCPIRVVRDAAWTAKPWK
jgi:hypothetical protein